MKSKSSAEIGKLQSLVTRLRAPDGCPWDREQTLVNLRAYVLEEAHEVAAAIDAGNANDLLGELGDLLFQVVFIAQLSAEDEVFDLQEVIDTIHTKMIDRHPHVFGDEHLEDADAVRRTWEERKLTQEKAGHSILAGVPPTLPALTAAYRMTQKVAGVGFDWSDAQEVLAKIREELCEVEEALDEAALSASTTSTNTTSTNTANTDRPSDKVQEEIGDLLFAVSNLARFLKIDPEATLAAANIKFRRRFQEVERALENRGRSLVDASLEEMDGEWDTVKRREREFKQPDLSSTEGLGT
jgi:MazG family protein